jgi:hypothetical protein
VAPGEHTNHIGNPAAGSWDQNGQWQWNNPESKEADSTMSYLAAAGAGAAGGALLSHFFTRKHFEERNPQGWQAENNQRTVTTYLDKRGQPISEEEYKRRQVQSEQAKKRYIEQQKAQLKADRAKLDADKKSFEQQRRDTRPTEVLKRPKPKKLRINRRNKRTRRR